MDETTQREMARRSFLRESSYFRISSPLFSALTRSCAQDDEILDLASVTRRGQSAGQTLPHSAYFLLLQSPDAELARYFPSMTDTPRPAAEAFPVFKEFCLDRRSELAELLSWRTANTNLVEKASFLLPSIQYVSQLSKEPLTLLEICCSAGLNLLFDEYHYDYGSHGCVGAEGSSVRLRSKVIGPNRPPIDSVPVVAHRVGVDLVKVNVSAPLDQLWMEAVLCPEWKEERKQLKAALEIRVAREIRTIIGDALDVVPSLLEELPGSLCILNSYCMAHWSPEAKVALEQVLLRGSRHRDIHRLSIEMPEKELPHTVRDRLAKLAKAGIPILQKSFPSRVDHTWYANGEAKNRLLARGDGFGSWVDWGPFDD